MIFPNKIKLFYAQKQKCEKNTLKDFYIEDYNTNIIIMKFFKNIKENNGVLTFSCNTNSIINKGLANALRRIIISNVPIIAIDKKNVNYIQNTSIFNSEFISRRLGFIPLNYNETKKYNLEELEFRLSAENNADEILQVFTKDMKVFNGEKELNINSFIAEPEILLLKLKPFQKIEFIAKCVENIQKNGGAEFSPTAVSIYTFAEDEKALNKALKSIPKELQKEFTIENKERLYLKDKDGEPLTFDYTIETIGQIKNKTLVKQSFDILINMLDKLVKGLTEGDKETIMVNIPTISMNAFDFVILNEGDTIGNLLQSYLLKNDNVAFAGYEIVHPLENHLVIRTSLKKDNTLENNKSTFISTITEIKKIVMNMKKEWKA